VAPGVSPQCSLALGMKMQKVKRTRQKKKRLIQKKFYNVQVSHGSNVISSALIELNSFQFHAFILYTMAVSNIEEKEKKKNAQHYFH